jgi:large subunit ribosomal protein L29
MAKISEMRAMSTEELQANFLNKKNELMNLRFQRVTGQLTDTSRIRVTRREVARYLTLLRERELAEAEEKESGNE